MIKALFSLLVFGLLGIGLVALIGGLLYTAPLWLIALYFMAVSENGL